MGNAMRVQIRQAKRAFADRNVEMARDLVRQDDVVDNLNRECFQLAIEIGDELDRREWAMTMMLVARALERIGDNAVDVGEQVAFLVTGLFREFEDASHPDGGRWPSLRRRPLLTAAAAGRSGVLDDQAVEDVHCLAAAVDRVLEPLVDVLPADHDHRIDATVER